MTKQFYFKQFNLAYIICLPSFCSILLIESTLSGASTQGKSGPGNNGNEGVLHIPQRSSIQLHNTIYISWQRYENYRSLTIRLFNVIFRTLVGGRGLPPLQRCSRIPTTQLTGGLNFLKKYIRNNSVK